MTLFRATGYKDKVTRRAVRMRLIATLEFGCGVDLRNVINQDTKLASRLICTSRAISLD